MPPNPLTFLLAALASTLQREQQKVIDYLKVENAILREQRDELLEGRRPRYSDRQRSRLARAASRLSRKVLLGLTTLVTPDTLRRWYRRLIVRKYDGTARRRPGRPRSREELRALVLRLSCDNTTWGYTRIRDELRLLGHQLARSTIAAILKEAGLTPEPEKNRGTPWAEFLAAHLGHLSAMDFLTVEVLTWKGLVRYHVLVVIELATRRVEVAGVTRQPFEGWMLQIGRQLTDPIDGCLRNQRYLIMDRDPVFTRAFRKLLRDSGVGSVRLPPRSPNPNAFAERFILSIKRECLDRIVPLGEHHLRWAIQEYLEHYHRERPHQGLDGQRIEPALGVAANSDGKVVCDRRLGGLLKSYRRAA